MALFAAAAAFVLRAAAHGLLGLALAGAAVGLLTLGLLAMLWRRPEAHRAPSLLVGGLYVLVVASQLAFGGFYEPSFGWLYVLPVAAATLTNGRQALIWTAVVAATTVLFWFRGSGDAEPTEALALLDRLGAIGCIALLIGLLRRWHADAERGVREAAEQVRQQEREMRRLALFDSLTGLPSRVFLERKLAYLVGSCDSFAVIFADLDRFKAINDTLGHPAGDELLVAVARRFAKVVGMPSRISSPRLDDYWASSHPVVARRGGDELIVVLPGADRGAAYGVASAIIEALDTPFQLGDRRVHVAVSMGVAVAPDHGGDAATLMRAADVALYEAKRRVGSSAAIYELAMTPSTPRSMHVEEALRVGIEADELRVVYQPLFDDEGMPRGAEALLRWRSAALGEVPPTELVPVAEATGLIVPIGRWVLAEACAQAQRWPLPLRLSVNVSPLQLRDAAFVGYVREALDASGLPARRLELEITESVLLGDDDEVARCLAALQELGVGLTVDDFGTGYSNLSYLRRLPVSRLKIDRAFVSCMDRQPADASLVGAIVAMGRSLGLEVVAEGVENAKQLEMLRDLGCHELQGFHLQEPLEREDFWIFARRRSDLLAAE